MACFVASIVVTNQDVPGYTGDKSLTSHVPSRDASPH